MNLRSITLLALFAGSHTSAVALADFNDLLRRVPGNANLLVMIDVEKMHASEYAKKQGWKKKHETWYVDSPVMMPPEARQFVIAAALDVGTMESVWEVAVMNMTESPSMSSIARAEGGRTDRFGGADAAWTPLDAYFIQLDERVMGVLHPANRQYASRWVRQKQTLGGESLSPFLKNASKKSDADDIVMALELRDAISAEEVLENLQTSRVVSQSDVDLEAMSEALSSIAGVTLRVRIGDKPRGQMKISFGRDVSIMKGFAKERLLEVLRNNGAMIEDFADWKFKIASNGKSIAIDGDLSSGALRKLLSIVELPVPLKAGETASADPKSTDADAMGYTSQRYFKSVTSLVDGLRKKGGANIGHSEAVWMVKYARKIDRLPILNVDADMVNFGGFVSGTLRDASGVLESYRQSARARAAAIMLERAPSRVAYGSLYSGTRTTVRRSDLSAARRQFSADRRQVSEEELAAGAVEATAILQRIPAATSEVRKTMTERYKIGF